MSTRFCQIFHPPRSVLQYYTLDLDAQDHAGELLENINLRAEMARKIKPDELGKYKIVKYQYNL